MSMSMQNAITNHSRYCWISIIRWSRCVVWRRIVRFWWIVIIYSYSCCFYSCFHTISIALWWWIFLKLETFMNFSFDFFLFNAVKHIAKKNKRQTNSTSISTRYLYHWQLKCRANSKWIWKFETKLKQINEQK